MATGKRPDGSVFASGANEGEVLDFPSVPRGWGVTTDGKDPDGKTVTDPTNGIPPMEWFNATQKRTDEAILWLYQNALPDWAAGTWPVNATVVNGGIVWRAQKETATEPAADAGDWLALFPLANLDKRYLHADKNLSDLTDTAKAKEVLALDQVGNWNAVQANGGLHSSGNHHIYLDWAEDGKLHVTVDTSDEGALFTTANPPTAADADAVPMSGGTLHEEASLTVISAVKNGDAGQALYGPLFRSCMQGRGGDGDFKDGGSVAFRIVEVISNYAYAEILVDGYGSIRSFQFRNDGSLHAPSSVYAGDAFMPPDGNVYGAVWGGYLSNYIAGQIGVVNNNIAAQINNNNAWVSQNFVNSVKLGAMGWVASIADGPGNGYTGGGGTMQTMPAGCVVIGGTNNGTSNLAGLGFFYRPIQQAINGQWVTIGQD